VNRAFFTVNGLTAWASSSSRSSTSCTEGCTRDRSRAWIVGVSGASGTPYARALLNALLDAALPVDLVVSKAARPHRPRRDRDRLRDAHWKDDTVTWLGPRRCSVT